jgi:DNA-binding LytR/AlgR family response regulator
MTVRTQPTALIAEDEPLLARALAAELRTAWPELQIAQTVGDGNSAVQQTVALLPDVVFLDVRMPGQNGLDAAADIADLWPADQALPLIVFVTAYDEYAVQAFERAAVDYLLKPVQAARLQQCVARLKALAARRTALPIAPDVTQAASPQLLDQLRQLVSPPVAPLQPPAPMLQRLQVSVGSAIVVVPIDSVLYFEAADKYVRVLTASKEYLIRTPIKDLLPQLDSAVFWQIHRSTVVRTSAIAQVRRDEAGRLRAHLAPSERSPSESLAISRLFAHLFKAM